MDIGEALGIVHRTIVEAAMADAGVVKLRLLRDDPRAPRPDGCASRFGLQDVKGAIHEGTLRADGKYAFEFALAVKEGSDPARPVFTGPFARGPRDERFVYLSWKRLDGQGYVNRIKVRLGDLDWRLVREAQAAGKPLEADMSGRGPGGGRVKVEWRVARD
jgi:hypothetical protein